MLGGASADGYVANALLQILAIGLLTFAFLSKPYPAVTRSERHLYLVVAGCILVVGLQFVPLPRGVWQALPGRARLLEGLDAAGIAFPGGFASLIPHESAKSAAWLLPSLAMLVTMTRARAFYSPGNLALALVAVMCLGVVVGAAQRISGDYSALYFYHFTNRGSAVGFFANANHMASLLLTTIPFQAALARQALDKQSGERLAPMLLVLAGLALTIVGVGVVGSIAGYVLMIPVTAASALILWRGSHARLGALLLLIALVVTTAILASGTGLMWVDRASGLSAGSRAVIFGRTWQAILDYWPAGSGLGTFAEAYPSYEDPLAVTRTYINHAHNDYLELLLETGALGVIAFAAFLAWWTIQTIRIWTRSDASPFAKAAVIASATLLLHSLVDYPLRTVALGAVFSACLALMASPNSTRKAWFRGEKAGYGE
ncbi:conserved hypothetical protein [Altererythrobacter sp. B11]|nr:conserved hypothetical protein [Altererythrobacter sp. B11]